MPTPKQQVIASLEQLPDTASYDDLLYRVYVIQGIQAGIADSRAGRVVSQEDLKREIFSWLHEKDDMPAQLDFSKGVRGRFFREGAKIRLPIYLDDEVQASLTALAGARGIDLSELVNELLKKDIELIRETR